MVALSSAYQGPDAVRGAPGIRLRDATKRFGRVVAVDGVTFEVGHGEVVGFLGPNGAGKTTTMRMLMGLLRATSGVAEIVSHGRQGEPEGRARTGYLPGVVSLYPSLTASGYLAFLARMRRVDCDARIAELAERLGLPLDRRIRELSKGNRQKVGLIQALMHDPRVLILDEPTSGLDPVVQREFERVLGEATARGAAVLLSSHVMSEVEHLADRVAIIDNGHLRLVESVSSLRQRAVRTIDLAFERPADPREFAALDSVLSAEALGDRVICTVTGSENALLARAVELGVVSVTSLDASLDDIFLSLITEGGRP